MMTEQYTVKTGLFEGPLDLLLNLIEKRKLSINDVSLSEVSDEYFKYIKSLDKLPVASTANFVLIASTLMLIKSLTLIPTFTLTEEEEASIEDLEARLKEYKIIKALGEHIDKFYGARKIFWPNKRLKNIILFSPDKSINAKNLTQVLNDCLLAIPVKENLTETSIERVISLEEMIDDLTERIQNDISTSFSKLTGHSKGNTHSREEKLKVIVGFLAMLELVKQEIVNVAQEGNFEEIKINTVN